ncbi:hypothetical protein [Terrimonas alba]|uniref:hypothetical protein n=1 Tax=Terrimonas alba TaxID=3349636 RepID=UPI0035F44651
MCTYNGCRVSRAQFIRLMAIEKELKNLRLNIPARNGFDYRDWPVIKPLSGGKDVEIKMTHWEYIPDSVPDDFDLKRARENSTWLNTRSESFYQFYFNYNLIFSRFSTTTSLYAAFSC